MKELNIQNRDKVLEIIGNTPFFKDFSEYERKRITAFHTHFLTYKMGEYIIREGREDTSFFIILSGIAIVVKAGRSTPLAELKTGDFFGEVSFLTNRPRTTNVLANEDVTVIRVDQELMSSLGAEIREKIKDKIIAKMVERLDEMNSIISKLSNFMSPY